MGRISVSIEIDATPDVVWSTIEPIERHVDWMADAEQITFEGEQRSGVGTRFVCITKVGPIRLADEMEVTVWEPGRRMGVRHSGLVIGEGVFELTPIDLDRRTRFTWTESLQFPWFLAGRLGELAGGDWLLRIIWQRNLQRLDRLITG